VVIKIRHGTAISWDGRIIRHCTSVTQTGEQNFVFGFFFGAKPGMEGEGEEERTIKFIQ